ncbi:MAG: carbon dioxide concentrating mechanism protein CcmL [Oscillospiraceae bacterium]|nr:carbon dioxide concentrating mechanism protein CcmL [Oscillospiraceae bacterium]
MKTGTVKGSVWSTKKVDGLMGLTLLSVETDTGKIVAVDLVGAGKDDRVLLTFGSAARVENPLLPVDAAIVGILDTLEAET